MVVSIKYKSETVDPELKNCEIYSIDTYSFDGEIHEYNKNRLAILLRKVLEDIPKDAKILNVHIE